MISSLQIYKILILNVGISKSSTYLKSIEDPRSYFLLHSDQALLYPLVDVDTLSVF